jgi:hypothetical protein
MTSKLIHHLYKTAIAVIGLPHDIELDEASDLSQLQDIISSSDFGGGGVAWRGR